MAVVVNYEFGTAIEGIAKESIRLSYAEICRRQTMLRDELNNLVQKRNQKTIGEADDRELYGALLEYTKEKLIDTSPIQGDK